ncbi:hypothetical protein [Streptomyces silvensis]|nr:hypothetical protein [Streptomyces silvensis]
MARLRLVAASEPAAAYGYVPRVRAGVRRPVRPALLVRLVRSVRPALLVC